MPAGPPCRPPDSYRFSLDLSIRPMPGSPLWELGSDVWFEIGGKGSAAWMRVPAGFRSDGASIPRFARVIFDRGDARFMRAAIIHDWLLSLAGFSPTVAALAFRDALVAGRVPRWRVTVMVAAVWAWTVLVR